MFFTLIIAIKTLFKTSHQARKSYITEFCQGYIKEDSYVIAKYIPKQQRLILHQFIENSSERINLLLLHSNTQILDMGCIMEELFEHRDSSIPYIAVILEYLILIYTQKTELTTDELIDHIATMIFNHSKFNPIPRYNNLICLIFYYLRFL